MQIDWLTVAAQIVNFLILVWLLKRFLYRPITQAMERREQRIADRLRQAQHKQEEAENEARTYKKKQEELEQKREATMAEAREAAESERTALQRQAREEIDAKKKEWLRQLEADHNAFIGELRERAAEQFYALAKRAFGDLASAELEEQVALRFVKLLGALNKEAAERLERACRDAKGNAQVRSRFELSANAKRSLTKALHGRLGDDVQVEYEVDEDIPCGIELKAGSQVLSWNFESYIDGLEEAVDGYVSDALGSSKERTAQ